ncbi:MAG: hypothetical protein ACPGXZ_09205 [Saprospiraceae bacterium]
MKKILFLGLIAIIIITSCSNDDSQVSSIDSTRRIINETDHHLDIMVYDDVDTFQFNLAPRSTFIVEGTCTESVFSGTYCNMGWNLSDNASIVFDNERIQRFELDENLECSGKAINGSIWSPECGYQTDYNRSSLTSQYRITQEDYENAEIL